MTSVPRRPYRRRSGLVSIPSGKTTLAVLSIAVPFAVAAIRIAATSRHIYLSDDLALIDLHVRDALHWQQQLGPFDRFGWNHPGPVYFYILAIPAWLIGSGARSEFLGAVLLNAACALLTLWVVRRRAGPRAALWCAACIGLLSVLLVSTAPGATTVSESPLGALVSPWNPEIVIFPLLLFGTLCAAGASGSLLSLLGAALAGTFCVQTNFSTFPLVVVLFLAAFVAALAQFGIVRRKRGRTEAAASHAGVLSFSSGAILFIVGSALLALAWAPPLVQQLSGHPGNMTQIWRFFTAHHPTLPLSTGLWSIVAVNGILLFGIPQEMSFVLGSEHPGALVVLVGTLLVGALAVAGGLWARNRFACALGAASLLGFAAAVASATRIVGPVYGYLVVWEVSIPVLGLIGLGLVVLSPNGGGERAVGPSETVSKRPRMRSEPGSPEGRWRTVLLGALSIGFAVALVVDVARLPPLERASDPNVAAAWHLVGPHLTRSPQQIFLGDDGTDTLGLFTFFGLFDELQARGYHPRVSPFWQTQVGPRYTTDATEPLQIVLYPPSPAVTRMAGYVGHTRYADIVIGSPGATPS